MDVTHDPSGGMDVHALVRRMVKRPMHPDCAYIISNREIAIQPGWTWHPYHGASPHDHHAHFAVGVGPDSAPQQPYDDTDPWGVAPTEEDDMTGEQDKRLKAVEQAITNLQADVDRSQRATSLRESIIIAAFVGDYDTADRLNADAKAKGFVTGYRRPTP